MCCYVGLYFLNLYPLADKVLALFPEITPVLTWPTELQAVAKLITFQERQEAFLVHFLFLTVSLAEAIHGCKVKKSFVFNAKSINELSLPFLLTEQFLH